MRTNRVKARIAALAITSENQCAVKTGELLTHRSVLQVHGFREEVDPDGRLQT